jgi:hypothetical protein
MALQDVQDAGAQGQKPQAAGRRLQAGRKRHSLSFTYSSPNLLSLLIRTDISHLAGRRQLSSRFSASRLTDPAAAKLASPINHTWVV